MRPPVALAAAAVLGLGACTAGARAEPGPGDGQRTVLVDVHHSRFSEKTLRVPVGTTVRFVVRNLDPIDHELIVGPPEVHQRHEEGTEREHHGDVAGEVSVPAGQTTETTYRFGRPGTVTFACHLAGHFDYGMRGTVIVG